MTKLREILENLVAFHNSGVPALKYGIAQAEQEILELTKAEAYKKFLSWVLEQTFDGCDLDGGDVQDELESLGLIVLCKLPKEVIEANQEKYAGCYEYDTDELFFPYYSEEAQRYTKAQKEKLGGKDETR